MRMRANEIGRLFGDFQLLLILFVAFRFVLLLGYQPFLLDGQERGVAEARFDQGWGHQTPPCAGSAPRHRA